MSIGEPARAALSQMGIVTPTPVQREAIPPLLAGRDLIAEAPTGSGKTLAFGLPMSERIDPKKRVVQALVLVPTRELATQVEEVLLALGKRHGFRTIVVCGGRAPGAQTQALRAGTQVVVGTPGRVLDFVKRGVLALQHLRLLVLDEADEMLDRGFAPDVERIIAHTPVGRQTALFSATVPDWVRTTATRHLRNPASVRVEPTGSVAPSIEHMVYEVGDGERLPALRALLDERGTGTTLVFGRTKHGVKALCRRLETLGYPVAALQGNLSQNARDRVVAEVRAGRVPILLATNVAARGIDIDHIERVINYELPETPELFTHRVGRTGRMGRHGAAITLLGPDDMARWRQFERALGHALPRAPWSGGQATAAQPRRVAASGVRPAVSAGARPTASPASRGTPAAQPRRAAAASRPIAAAPRTTTMPARPSGPSHGPQARPAAGPTASRRRRSRYHGARPAAVAVGRRG